MLLDNLIRMEAHAEQSALLTIHSNRAIRLKWKIVRPSPPPISPCSEKKLQEIGGDTSQRMEARRESTLH